MATFSARSSSLLGNTQRGVVLLNAGINKEIGLESKPVKTLCIACLAVATVICFTYGGSPTQLIFIANVATSIATPVAGLFMVLMLWKKELFMGTKAPRVLQVSMTICYIFALYMTVTALKTQIPNLIHSLWADHRVRTSFTFEISESGCGIPEEGATAAFL